MKTLSVFLLVLGSFTAANAVKAETARPLDCGFDNVGMRVWDVRLFVLEDGKLGASAEVSIQGRMHKESVTGAPLGGGEAYHLWLSKNSGNDLEMIVYAEQGGRHPALMINHNVPYFKEVRGSCSF